MNRDAGYSNLGSLLPHITAVQLMMSHSKWLSAALILILLGAGLFTYRVAAQEEVDDLPLGLQITETLHTIIEEHKQAIKSTILEFKLMHEELIENKTEIIKGFIEERLNRTLQIKEAIRDLNALYAAGNITREEYLARLTELRSELKALAKSAEKLGKLLQEFSSQMKDIVKEKVEKLREINREFGRSVAEEARKIKERIRNELREGEETNSTSTTTVQSQNNDSRGIGRGRHSFATTAPQTEGAGEQQRGNERENRGRGHEAT